MLIAALVCIVVFPPWQGILAWLAPLPDTVQEEVDAAVNRDLAGIIVYVDQAGREPTLYRAGWKDRDNKVPADPDALFKIASISKLYVAVAAAKLVHSGSLSLDDTIADHLPELTGRLEHIDHITLRMMLQHRSGLPNYSDHEDFDWANPPSNASDSLDLAATMPPDFEPDADYRYSNTNYLLIGSILDKALGYSHKQYIHDQIVTPLGLTDTYGSLDEVDLEKLASGYHHPYELDFKEVAHDSPSGAMIATARDVGVFLRALNDGSLLNDEKQAIYSSVYRYGHKGWLLGYQSIARYHEDIDAVVVQLVNTTGGDSELVSLVTYDRIVRVLRGQ